MTETEGNTAQMRRLAGEVFVDDFGRRNCWCKMDWRIGSAFQEKGYAAEAASAAMEFLLGEAGFHRVQAKCAAENAASLRVMEKLGMRREGVLREFFRDRESVITPRRSARGCGRKCDGAGGAERRLHRLGAFCAKLRQFGRWSLGGSAATPRRSARGLWEEV